MVFKKYIQKPLLLFCTFLLIATVVIFPVSAEGLPDIQFFDFDEYSSYTYDESTGLITADVQLPASWQWTYVHDGANFATWYNSFNFTTFGIDSPLACDFNSFAKVSVGSTINKAQIPLGNFLDLQYLPSGSTLNVELVTAFMDRNLVSNFADVFVAFVDSTGKVISYSTVSTSVEVYQMGRDGQRYTVTASYTFDSVPTGAKGFYYVTRVTSGLSVDGAEIPVVTTKNSIVFKYSEQDYNIKQDKIIRDSVSNIDKQLGDLINGTPEQNQQVQDAIGDLNNSTDKLGQLGDQMASVEKPSIDSSQISAGSLVPSTSLLVFSVPFQALWENSHLLAMLTIVVTLVLVSWVFFGKKG